MVSLWVQTGLAFMICGFNAKCSNIVSSTTAPNVSALVVRSVLTGNDVVESEEELVSGTPAVKDINSGG